MKRVRCPKCDHYITFDETQYEDGQSLVFECPECRKQFGIRIGASKLRATRKEETVDENENDDAYGSIVVVENVFHYKQVLPLKLGDNVIEGAIGAANPEFTYGYVKAASVTVNAETAVKTDGAVMELTFKSLTGEKVHSNFQTDTTQSLVTTHHFLLTQLAM